MQKTCIVIPCYNEERRFPRSEFISFLKNHSTIDFCFVNDGSKDRTYDMLLEIGKGMEDKIFIVNLKINKGKAEAVRSGVVKAIEWKKFEYVGYFDADLSTPLKEIHNLIRYLEKKPEYLLAFGSRVKLLGAKIKRNAARHYFSRIFSTFASLFLRLPVYDTQCGAKLMKVELADKVFIEPFISPWLFDIEILKRITLLYGIQEAEKSIIEVPLEEWINNGDSRIKPIHLAKIPFEFFNMFIKYRQKK